MRFLVIFIRNEPIFEQIWSYRNKQIFCYSKAHILHHLRSSLQDYKTYMLIEFLTNSNSRIESRKNNRLIFFSRVFISISRRMRKVKKFFFISEFFSFGLLFLPYNFKCWAEENGEQLKWNLTRVSKRAIFMVLTYMIFQSNSLLNFSSSFSFDFIFFD